MCAKNHFSVTLFGIDPKLLVEMLLNEIERLESDKIDQLADRKALEKTLGVIKNSEVGYTSAQEDQDRAQYYEQKYEAS
ncbi:MAG: hypothetical protein U1C52_02245 [Patescibacteria group bacterium]|nr:hypothetical protein [Patescibacteria group bacterium]